MVPADPFAPPGPDAVSVGTGRLTLDVIVRAGAAPAEALSQAGGTCGNVLANLAWLGWRSYPLTDLGDDDAGERFAGDLRRWGVHLDLVRRVPGAQTPVIVHHIRRAEGQAVHSYSSRCPFCDARLRYYEPVPPESVRQRLAVVPPRPAVCFFDRDSEAALLLTRHCAAQGALVVFEPNYAGPEVQLAEALAVAHVLKYARDKLPDLERRLDPAAPLLVVETLGAEGLRYRDGRPGTRRVAAEWRHEPAFPVAEVRDAGGSGDWCTAGLIHRLGQGGREGLWAATADDVREALRFGQALAAWNCAFEGARGSAYHGDRDGFIQAVRQILAGVTAPRPAGQPSFDRAGRFCPRCRGEGLPPV
jgi:fructokinase